jgi:hypothetical protein
VVLGGTAVSCQLVGKAHASNVGSKLDVQDDTGLLQADPDGKHQLNGELDDDVDKATEDTMGGETTDDNAHQDP